MGVNVSTEDFATLEGFVNKSNDERAEILRNAGWEPEGQDNDIATFIGTDIVSAALIRSVTTVCLDKKEANMKEFYKADAEKLQQHFTATVQEYYKELEKTKYELTIANEKLLKQDKELSVYYSSISAETHVANMEIGKTDRAEYAHLHHHNNPPTGILIETEEKIWNDFVNGEDNFSKSEGKKRCHVTTDGYDKKDNDAMTQEASGPFEGTLTQDDGIHDLDKISQGKDTLAETEPTNTVEDIKTETKSEVPVLAMDIKMLIDMLDKAVLEDTIINNNNDKTWADNIETTEMDIDKEITSQIHTTTGK
ncbi:hypothetical protein RhiirC2_813243 [Rhizophagus irregularis]|uniref:Uncharacterized protein n=1 Tax=Rhizophagus irregularis TaxID=588596 RepID=A0A2N1MNI6_9GLOM|nr:hypothetical protein RhiirC2_813243 [Rhizophagus irregularis]